MGSSSPSGGRQEPVTEHAPVSVIVCAHNEAIHLEQHLPLLLAQDYPSFELIVVNDASTDETAIVLDKWAATDSRLHIVTIKSGTQRLLPGKKWALQHGVAAAQYESLLLTDADCRPASDQWLSLMSLPLQQGRGIAAGYGACIPGKGLLNLFVRWETLHTFIQYSSYTRTGVPYMAVGRNLACKKELLQQAARSPLWASMPSGDDDLLIRETADSSNMVIIADPDAFTFSAAKNSWKDWLAQKQRHVSTGKCYRKSSQLLLGAYGASHGLMWLLFLVLLCCGYGSMVSGMMLLRCLLTWTVWSIAAHSMKERRLFLSLPLCDVGWALYNFALSPYIFFKNKQRWK